MGQLSSIYELAEKTGLSVSTISRVLNQRGRISKDTRIRVLNAAREAGFRPRASARQNTLAVVMDRFQFATYGGFQSTVLSHLLTALPRYKFAAEVYTEDNVATLGTRFVDGVLALTWSDATIQKLQELSQVPVVLINRVDVETFSTAATDHFQSGQLVANHLIDHGHRRIGFLGEERDWGAGQRIEGLRQTLKSNKLDPSGLVVGFTDHGDVYRALERVLADGVTALFLAGEDLTIEATYLLKHRMGRRIPDDISVVGLENPGVSPFVHPPLTTIAQPLQQLAEAAMQIVTELIETNDQRPAHRILDNELIVRQSVRRIEG